MNEATRAMEAAAWAAVDGIATTDQLALLEADAPGWRRALERLLDDTEDNLDAVRGLVGPERDQAVSDLEAELERARAGLRPADGRRRRRRRRARRPRPRGRGAPPGVVVGQRGGRVGRRAPTTVPAAHDDLSDRLEGIGGPAVGWNQHRGVPLPTGDRAAALSIPVADALGWLVAVGGGLGGDGVGSSVTWLGRVAVRRRAHGGPGRIIPALRSNRRQDGRLLDVHVRWIPADVDHDAVDALAQAMPGPVAAMSRADAKAVVLEVLRRRRRRHRLRRRRPGRHAGPAAGRPHGRRRRRGRHHPPRRLGLRRPRRRRRSRSPSASSGGSSRSPAPAAHASSCSSTRPTRAAPGSCPSWAGGPRAACCPSSSRSPTAARPSPWPTTSPGSSACYPVLLRAGGQRRGQVYLKPGRGLGAHDRHRCHARGRGLRGAGSGPVAPRRRRRPCACSRAVGRHRRRCPSAQRRPLVGRVRRRRAVRRRHLAAGVRGPPPRPVAWPVGRARPGRPQGGGGRPGRAGHARPSSPAPRSCATPSGSRARRWRAGSPSRARAGPPTCCPGRRTSPPTR